MPGYRSGFVAGDPEIIAALKKYRPNVGVAPPEFFQRAAIAAWNDEDHVDEVRERYRAKRDVLLPALEALGLRSAGGDASFFLWVEGVGRAGRRVARGGRRRRARLVLRPGGRGLPAARARPAARGLRARDRDRQSFACSAALSPAQLAGARERLDGAGLRVAAEQQAVGAAQLAGLDDVAVGQRDERARRDVEPGLDRAVVAERDADAGVGAEQAALADR